MSHLSPEDFNAVRRNAPLVSIDLIIRDAAGRVLLGYRKNQPAKGIWFVPGGRIRKDERLAAAFARTLRDELGDPHRLGISTQITDATFKGVYEHLYDPTPETPYSIHYVVLAYEISATADATTLPESQHDGWRWQDPATLVNDETVHPNTRAYFP